MNAKILAIGFLALLALANANPSESCPAVDGTYATILRNTQDCTAFYICSNGTPYSFQCPDGLEFNDELDVCDWPQNAGCVVDVTTRAPRTTTTRRPRTTTTKRPSTTTRRSKGRIEAY